MEKIPYINAGVLLIDLKKWRAEQTGRRILEYYREHDGNLFANDQDAINGCLKGEICYLPPRYNFYNIYWFYSYQVLKKLMGEAWYYDEAIYRKLWNIRPSSIIWEKNAPGEREIIISLKKNMNDIMA